MNAPVTRKSQMYDLLARGAFGNTIGRWFDVDAWQREGSHLGAFWGVRTQTPGGPCRLYCPSGEVAETAARFRSLGHAVNISLMIDAVVRVTLWADVYDAEGGLIVYGIENPPRGGSWRQLMPAEGREWRGMAARLLLSRHLWPSSLSDLEALRSAYPGHVYELSACETPFGTIPGRNAVLWEVRLY